MLGRMGPEMREPPGPAAGIPEPPWYRPEAARRAPLTREAIVDAAEAFLVDAPERERTTSEIGEQIMNQLKGLDTVAYIRFASVYRDFKDVREFKEELEGLLGGRVNSKGKKHF